jgi:hypothetical protein
MKLEKPVYRHDVELSFKYWKVYDTEGHTSDSVAFHFADEGDGDAVWWINAIVKVERGPRKGQFRSETRDNAPFKPPARGAFASFYRKQGWDEPRQWSEVSSGLSQKLGATQWVATLEARFDPEAGRVIWHVLTGTLRRPGEENLARDRIEMEQEILNKLGVKGKSKASRRVTNADSDAIENPVTYEPGENSSEFGQEVPF